MSQSFGFPEVTILASNKTWPRKDKDKSWHQVLLPPMFNHLVWVSRGQQLFLFSRRAFERLNTLEPVGVTT